MILIKHSISEKTLRGTCHLVSCVLNRQLNPVISTVQFVRGKHKNDSNPPQLFKPVMVKPNPDDINVGEELCGALCKSDLIRIINKFIELPEVQTLSAEYGLDDQLRASALKSFHFYCLRTPTLPTDLHICISDILQGAGHISDIFPYYLRHAKQMYPHLSCIDELKKISDLRNPANWYPTARAKTRKIIFHAGPTNSGKTYHALERFMKAKSGVYCGPLKLLVAEVFHKSNTNGTPCDLLTGEEKRTANSNGSPANHLSCSVEMVNLNQNCEVAVIDEIQLIRDPGRGWAWTRALLGIPADEIHLCGEEAAINLVKALCATCGEDISVHRYKRLSELIVEDKALTSLDRVAPGDCIVCFNKNDIFSVSRALESKYQKIAVIYGSLPPGTKLAQAARFNDPNDSCKVLVATNAIGMGLNLHIRRVIFYSLVQPSINEKGEREMNIISVSSALQIAGRAGRFGTQWPKGYVTTFKPDDLHILKQLMKQNPEEIAKAGLHPTPDQIELYAFHLPHATLSNLMDIFVSLCTVDDSLFFMCNVDDFKFLADMIQHVPLPLRARYLFCCAPINKQLPFVCSMFLKFARQYSRNNRITFNWLCEQIGWPFALPRNIVDLLHMEAVFDVLDLYLWLSYRFPDLFPDLTLVRDMQKELDKLIQEGIIRINALLVGDVRQDVTATQEIPQEENFEMQRKKQKYLRDSVAKKATLETKGEKLSQRLLEEGLLTREMLEQLQYEWSNRKKRD